jgi:hypothetical protein
MNKSTKIDRVGTGVVLSLFGAIVSLLGAALVAISMGLASGALGLLTSLLVLGGALMSYRGIFPTGPIVVLLSSLIGEITSGTLIALFAALPDLGIQAPLPVPTGIASFGALGSGWTALMGSILMLSHPRGRGEQR